MISNDRIDELEEQLTKKIADLPIDLKQEFYFKQKKSCKDPDTYAALNWFFVCGLHHYYIGSWIWGTLNLLLMLIGFMTLGVGGGILILIVFLIELPRLFFSQRIIREYNLKLSEQIYEEISKTNQ